MYSVAKQKVVARSEESGELKKVSCGGHDAKVCYRCPVDPDTGRWNGESGCNGDCKWNGHKGCEPKTAAEIEEDISQFLRGNKEEKYY